MAGLPSRGGLGNLALTGDGEGFLDERANSYAITLDAEFVFCQPASVQAHHLGTRAICGESLKARNEAGGVVLLNEIARLPWPKEIWRHTNLGGDHRQGGRHGFR